jgi:hypothetical protein
MLLLSTIAFTVVVTLGLLAARLRTRAWLGALHGTLGACSLLLLLFSLRGPPRGAATGTGAFGQIAASFFAAALLIGIAPILARYRRKPVSPLVLGLHATVALMGFLVLVAYVTASD